MDKTRKFEIPENELESRLYLIRKQYGIDASLLFSFLNSAQIGNMAPNLSKHARRKLRRRLEGSQQVFEKLNDILSVHRESLQSAPDEYASFIYNHLTSDQRKSYDSGEWTPEVLEVVSIAQKKHYHPNRAPSPAEAEPRARFHPAGQYRTHWNR